MNKISTLIFLFALATSALAQGVPFRLHRYDGFKVHPVDAQSVVFFGNSITNMHPWWEAFGNAHIVNRGVNGAETPIMLQHLETVLAGHPAKLFLMMGTNDLGTPGMNSPAHVARNVREALRRCQKESPRTKVYVQSILPCTTNASRVKDVRHVPIANDSLRNVCREFPGVEFIDLYPQLTGIADGTISYDGTHLTMSGYRTWCKTIAPYVGKGAECVYPDTATDANFGLGGVNGMRTTTFSALPVRDGDIVVIGDDGNSWHELLHSIRVKQRGGSWGYRVFELSAARAMLPGIFTGRADNGTPAAVCLALGYKEAHDGLSADRFAADYAALLADLRRLLPATPVKVLAVYPSPSADVNTRFTVPYNERLRALADTTALVDFVPAAYTALEKDGAANPLYFANGYLQGRGYAKLSQVLAAALGDSLRPVSDEEAAAAIALFDARTALFAAADSAENRLRTGGVGQSRPKAHRLLTRCVKKAYALLAADTKSGEKFIPKAAACTDRIKRLLREE